MKGRTKYWILSIFLVAVVLGGNLVTGKKTSRKCPRSSRHTEIGSTTTYGFPFTATLGRTYTSLISPIQQTLGYASNLASSVLPIGYAQNLTSEIHQQIMCGDTFPRACENSRYRSYDGSCNNLRNPTWGMANTRYARLLPANYGDGIRSPTISVTGEKLPLSRLVSFTVFQQEDVNDPIWTLAAMQWGQIITHDMAMIDGTTQSKRHVTRCCTDDGQLNEAALFHGQCYPIIIPYNDPTYSEDNIECLNFVRSTTDLDRGCSSQYKPAEQLTVVSHFLDLSLVYGSSEQVARSLRAGVGGRLSVEIRHNREWPPAAANKTETCDVRNSNEVCYRAGDSRVNQNPQLTILQIILLREHNRIADALARLNPHWTDETIFQEARRIAIAEHQHITYYEWLPIFLGTQGTYGNKVVYDTKDYVNDYNPTVNPSVLNEHSTAAFRYFHSLIAGYLSLVNEYRSKNAALRLSNHFNKPGIIEEGNNMDDLTRGMSYQPEKASDPNFDEEIMEYLFRGDNKLGSDLRARDIHRNRDHGLASYNTVREYCGLPRARSFADFGDYISPSNVERLSKLYASPDDVDLTVGGSLEAHVPGTLSGPTFLCILTKQFYRTRVGDRYWYERGDYESAFTIEQLNEIRKSSISRLFCDNGDHITTMQRRGFQQVSPTNPLLSCNDIPSIDLSLWKDYAPEIANHHDNIDYPDFKK